MELNRVKLVEKQIGALIEMAETFKKHGNSSIDGEMLELTLKTIILAMNTINNELKELRKMTEEH